MSTLYFIEYSFDIEFKVQIANKLVLTAVSLHNMQSFPLHVGSGERMIRMI